MSTRREFLTQTAAATAMTGAALDVASAKDNETTPLSSHSSNPVTGIESYSPGTIIIDGEQFLVRVDTTTCRWSVELKGTDVKLNNIHFLPGDNPSGWTVTARINRDDRNDLGSFETITLHGTMKGRLDFDYHISASKTGNDIIVRLDRANHTDGPVEIADMDYMVVEDARLGGTINQWMTFGCSSDYGQYYGLTLVADLPILNRGIFDHARRMYEVCYLARNVDTGKCILVGHLTVHKGHSRFEISRKDVPDRMSMKAYCSYGVTMPARKRIIGEKLVLHLGGDGLRALEHLGDLIALANDIRLKQKRPLNLDDKALISCTHSRWIGWASGGTAMNADKFIKVHGLDRFYYCVAEKSSDFGADGSWGLYYAGGNGRWARKAYPPECYLPVQTPMLGDGRVVDFSNPLAVKSEAKRIEATYAGVEKKVNFANVDFSDSWDKWPGQKDPTMSATETWRAAGALWRDFVDSKCPRLRNHSCVTKVDFNYGLIDLARISDDADGMGAADAYTGDFFGQEYYWRPGFRGLLGECAVGAAMRFFYNARVFWNNGDNFHVYKYDGGRLMSYAEAKVTANYKAIATSCIMPSEAFDVVYPEDRIELLKRVAPPTADAAYPVDLFVRKPAAVWNLPVEREFGKWNVLGVFNFGPESPNLVVTLDAEADLRLDSNREYFVYEFWSRKLVGTFKGTFVSRAVPQKDCDIYSIVEKQDWPVLLSTSRHVRQMAFDIRHLRWDSNKSALGGVSRAVRGDPYQLRIYVPTGYRFDQIRLSSNLSARSSLDGNLLIVDYTTSSDDDIAWSVYFQ